MTAHFAGVSGAAGPAEQAEAVRADGTTEPSSQPYQKAPKSAKAVANEKPAKSKASEPTTKCVPSCHGSTETVAAGPARATRHSQLLSDLCIFHKLQKPVWKPPRRSAKEP